MANHEIRLHATVPVLDQAPKPRPQCCEGAKARGPVWWEAKAVHQTHPFPVQSGWVAVLDCSIPGRTYWLYNPVFCPLCGTKLAEKP